jgi:hypothetical protein
MPKKFFKKYIPTPEQIRSMESLRFLGTLIHDPNLWHLNRRSVAGAFAIGLFTCFIPLPGQMVVAALMAIIFRVNLPIAVALVWVSNPVTMPPMFYLAYEVGAKVMGVKLQHFSFEFSLDWLFLELGSRWRPFLLGCLIMASLSSLAGFITIRVLWRMHLLQRIKARKILQTLKVNILHLQPGPDENTDDNDNSDENKKDSDKHESG